MFWHAFFGVTCLKLLFLPCYFSTDFEVHRNWLAITHSKPLREWYTEATSEWTLDYPPFFAWFEYLLSQVAKFLDPRMLDVSNLNYRSSETILFQRLSVIVCDLLLAFGIQLCLRADDNTRSTSKSRHSSGQVLWPLLILLNGGLILVDHIHFQYNGFLFGILLASIGTMLSGQHLWSAALFVVLLNLKHIFLYCAPAYFAYLFFSYCFKSSRPGGRYYSWKNFSILNLVKLGLIVLTGFAVSLGPFVYQGQLFNVLSRLFPFKRGLTHAYWAPNFWAIYNAVDLVGSRLVTKFIDPEFNPNQTLTAGLVQSTNHVLLPEVTPIVTFALTVIAQVPALIQLIRCPKEPIIFVRALVLCSFASFLFGWHVHEKAILMVTVPLALLTTHSASEGRLYLILSTVGTFSLFPLVFEIQETNLKLGILMVQVLVTLVCLQRKGRDDGPNLSLATRIYLMGLGVVFISEHFLAFSTVGMKYQFLPLLLYSTYSSVGIVFSFLALYRQMFNYQAV